jgi:ribosomal protein S18 acetylase RimI-like enzyme
MRGRCAIGLRGVSAAARGLGLGRRLANVLTKVAAHGYGHEAGNRGIDVVGLLESVDDGVEEVQGSRKGAKNPGL